MQKKNRCLLFILLLITAISLFAFSSFAQQDNSKQGEIADLQLISAEGEVLKNFSYFQLGDAFALASKAENKNSTVRLNRDVEYYEMLTIDADNASFTFDLNGHTFRMIHTAGQFWNDEGELVKEISKSDYCFFISHDAENVEFSVVSSDPDARGVIYSVGATQEFIGCDKDGNVLEITPQTLKNSTLFCTSETKGAKVEIENIDIFASSILDASASETDNLEFTMTSCAYYTANASTGKTAFNLGSGAGKKAEINLCDSLFYITGVADSSGKDFVEFSSSTPGNITVTFSNCDILSKYSSAGARFVFKTKNENQKVYLNNCRLSNGLKNSSTSKSEGSVFIGSGCYYSDKVAAFEESKPKGFLLADNNEEKPVAKEFSHTLPLYDEFVLDNYAVLLSDECETRVFTYNLTAIGEDSYASVSWYAPDGSLIETVKTLKGQMATAPKLPVGDGYRDAVVEKWINLSDGSEASLTLGNLDTYHFKATEPGLDAECVANIDALYNYSFYTHFQINIYLPYREGMEAPVVTWKDDVNATGSFNHSGKTVFINSKKYWVYTKATETDRVFTSLITTVTFTIDKEYEQIFTVDAYNYVKVILEKEDATEIEKISVSNMARYVRAFIDAREALLGKDGEGVWRYKRQRTNISMLIGGTDGEGIERTGIYNSLPPFQSEYGKGNYISDSAYGYVESVYYEISGASAQFVINIYQDVGAELKSVSFGGKIHEFSRSGNKYKSKSVRIYDLIAETEIIVTVGDEEKRIVYSMENYISYLKSQGENTELVEAMYAFGVAARNYKSSR